MTKHSRFGHNSYSNPFMCPDTRQRGELLYLSVIGSRLKISTVIGQNCPGQPGTGNGTNMIYLMSENCCRDTWRSRDRICNVANCGEFARQGHSYDRLMQGVPGLMIISS